jgi:hypothetical protein
VPELISPEAERNRLLRRVDWRFLLPYPEPSRILCLSSGVLARAVNLISPLAIENGPPYELVAARNPDTSALEKAFTALECGGAFYGEWQWPWPRGIDRVRGELERAGFNDVRLYWPVPSLSRAGPALWLPLDDPAPVRAYLEDHREAHLIQNRLRLRAWDLGQRSGLLAPICAVAGKPGGERDAGRTIAGVDIATLLGADQSADVILLTGGRRSQNKVVALLYVGRKVPFVLKMARISESVPGLRREAAVLEALRGAASRIGGIPTIRGKYDRGDSIVVAETAVAGQSLYHLVRPDTYRHLCLQVTEWLIRLAHNTLSNPYETWWDRTAGPTLGEFRASHSPGVSDAMLIRAAAALRAVGPLPTVCEHRDCSPWNVSITETGECGVVDWESARLRGTPIADLAYFLTYMALFLEGTLDSGREESTYRALLDPETATGAVADGCLTLYCQALGLDRAVLPAIRLWTWMIHARSERERLLEDAVHGRPTLDRSLFVRLWQEEILQLGF